MATFVLVGLTGQVDNGLAVAWITAILHSMT